MQSEQPTDLAGNVLDAADASQRARDLALRIERVAVKALDRITARLGLGLFVLMALVGFAVVFPMKGWGIHYLWWVFQLGQTEFFVDTRLIWFAMRWMAPLIAGVLLSLIAMKLLKEAGAEERTVRLNLIGMLISAAALVLIVLDLFRVLPLGSITSQAWAYPASMIGLSLSMISLSMTRESVARDRTLSTLVSLVPVGLMFLPAIGSYLLNLSEPALTDVVLSILLWSGVAYAMAGRKLDLLYQGLTFDKLAKWSGVWAAVALVLIGIITNGPRSYFVDLRWLGGASAGLAISLLAMQMIRKPNAANKDRGAERWSGLLGLLAFVASLAVLVATLVGAAGAFTLGTPDWLFPASVLGIALGITALNMHSLGSAWDKALSFCVAGAAVIVLGLPLIRHVNVEMAGYVLAVLAVIVLVVRFQRAPTATIKVKRLEGRRNTLEAVAMATLIGSALLLSLFVLGKGGVVSAGSSFIMGALVLGVLGSIVLFLTRATPFADKIATLALVGAALFYGALPGISGWNPALHPGTILTIYVGGAILYLLAGIRPFAMYSGGTVFREKARLLFQHSWKVVAQVMKNPMGVVGTVILVVFIVLAAFGPQLAPYSVPAGSAATIPGVNKWDKYILPAEARIPAPAWVIDVVWGLPIAAGIIASVIMLGIGSKRNGTERKARSPFAAAGLVLSSGLMALVLLDLFKVLRLGSPEWMYPASAAGIALAIVSFHSSHASTIGRMGWAGIGLGVVALALVASTTVMPSGSMRAQEVMLAYIGAGALVIGSGVLLRKSLRLSANWRGGPDPPHTRTALLFGVGLGAALILAGIMAWLQSIWTAHWMGTDVFGFDIFSELLYGARTSIIVGIISAIIASVLGALVGLYSGYVGGWTDEVIMRANDVVLSIPWLVLMIIVAAMLKTIDLTGIILIIGLTGWSTTARMVRAQVLSIRERQYIERAKAIGATDLAIIRRHILPNAFPLVFANTILTVAVSILSEATLSFLGMRPVGVVTWGTMLSYAADKDAFSIGLQGWIVAPGLCIVVIVLGFTLLGYALDDVLNPKLRKR